jgi:hypothetical protein
LGFDVPDLDLVTTTTQLAMAETRKEREDLHGISMADISQSSTLNNNSARNSNDNKYDSDSTATNSSDEFDWDAADGDEQSIHQEKKAKRGRRVWLAFMKLARPVRYVFRSFQAAVANFFLLPQDNHYYSHWRRNLHCSTSCHTLPVQRLTDEMACLYLVRCCGK